MSRRAESRVLRAVSGIVLVVCLVTPISGQTVDTGVGVRFSVPQGWELWPEDFRSLYEEARKSSGGQYRILAGFAADSTSEWNSLPHLVLSLDTIPTSWNELEASKADLRLPPHMEKKLGDLGVTLEETKARIDRADSLAWLYAGFERPEGDLVLTVTAMRPIRGGLLAITHYGYPEGLSSAEAAVQRLWASITINPSKQYDDAIARRQVSDNHPLGPVRQLIVALLGAGLILGAVALAMKARSKR
ncbi:MAG: hypothetical protein ACRD1R_08125 [Acidobacteriota bacterium]